MTGPFLKIRNSEFFWANTIPNFWTDRVFKSCIYIRVNLFSIKSGNTIQIFYNDYVVGTADSNEFSRTGPSSDGKPNGTCLIKGED